MTRALRRWGALSFVDIAGRAARMVWRVKAWASVGVAVAVMGSAAAACGPDRVEISGAWGRAAFRVALADTPEARAQGLMFVEAMPLSEGMLFVYDTPRPASFWMRNTLIPLDIIFAGSDGVITRVHPNAVPLDETPIPGGEAVQFVLEINGGLAARIGISPGDQLRHPIIAPCG